METLNVFSQSQQTNAKRSDFFFPLNSEAADSFSLHLQSGAHSLLSSVTPGYHLLSTVFYGLYHYLISALTMNLKH